MGFSIASESFKVNCIFHAARPCLADRVAGLVRSLVYPDLFAAVLEHLRHKRKSFLSATWIECSQNLIFAEDLDDLPCAEVQNGWGFSSAHLHLEIPPDFKSSPFLRVCLS